MTGTELPQVWTSEHSAVRALASLAIMHPREFSEALNGLTGHQFDVVDPATVRRERFHTDLSFRTESGQEVFIEAKIEHFATVDQLNGYRAALPGATALLLVAGIDAPDVRAVQREEPEIGVLAWGDLLRELEPANPLARQLLEDVTRLIEALGNKYIVRKIFASALADASLRDASPASAVLTHTARQFPCVDIVVPGSYVYAQVQSTFDSKSTLWFVATVGFKLDKDDVADEPSRLRMSAALKEAWEAALVEEGDGALELSRNRQPSKLRPIFGLDEPYQARGYRDDYVGVKTKRTSDPVQAIRAARSLAVRFAAISRSTWDEAGSA